MTGSSLPIGYRKGVLQREQAAEYLGVSPSLFDEMVGDGRMPKAVVLSERRYGWVQDELDACIAELPRKGQAECVRTDDASEAEKQALEKFDATRKAAQAQKSPASH
jgi:predicted DNA-binding transcriptional regulator AlpA